MSDPDGLSPERIERIVQRLRDLLDVYRGWSDEYKGAIVEISVQELRDYLAALVQLQRDVEVWRKTSDVLRERLDVAIELLKEEQP